MKNNFRIHDTTGSQEIEFTERCPFWNRLDDSCNINNGVCRGYTPPDECILKTKQIIITHVGED
jgi:hypothetical protein